MTNFIRGRINKPLKTLTKLEAEYESKRRAAQEMEKLEALGQESDIKAAREIAKFDKEDEKAQRESFAQDMAYLIHFKKNKIHYNRFLTHIFLRFASLEDISRKYPIEVDVNEIGIVVKIKGTNYQGAFRSCGLPSFDRNACKILAVKLGNTIAKLEGYNRKTNAGIILPDNEDLKKYK